MHGGHRQRMRDRIENHGIDSLSDHEVLEYLLYYVQPRVNTNEQAHRLLDTFGSFSAVFDADADVLEEVKGIGPQSASFLSLLPEICRRYYMDCYRPKAAFHSIGAIVDYLQKLYLGVKEEKAAIVLLDSSCSLICSEFIAEGSSVAVQINRQEILYEAIKKKTTYVILAHNHPSNQPRPSSEDLVLTNHIAQALSVVGLELVDHIILCPNGSYYSFAVENRL